MTQNTNEEEFEIYLHSRPDDLVEIPNDVAETPDGAAEESPEVSE